MNGLILALFVSTGGIETTWERTADGETVYVVQLDDQAIAALKQGYPITSAIPAELRGVKSIRLQYGSTPLLKPALPEPQGTVAPVSTQGQWTSNQPNGVVLAAAPQDPGTLTPAEAFQLRQSGNEIRYPDRRRPMETTVAGQPASNPSGQGTFSAPSLPAGTFPQTPTGTSGVPTSQNTYEGQSLLSNGQVNPLGTPQNSGGTGGVPLIPGPANTGTYNPNTGTYNANPGAFNPNTLTGNPAGQIRIPMSANDGNTAGTGQFNTQQYGSTPYSNPQNDRFTSGQLGPVGTGQNYGSAPPLISGPSISPPSGSTQGSGYWQGGAAPGGNQVGWDPRIANAQGNYGGNIQPVPASNQPANNIPTRPVNTFVPTLPGPINQAVGGSSADASSNSNAWWQLVNHQNANATSDSGSKLADSLSRQTKFTNTSNRSTASSPTTTLPKTSDSDRETIEEEPASDSSVATLGLLFLSMGLNIYLIYLLRGFYIKTRQLARDLRETVATV